MGSYVYKTCTSSCAEKKYYFGFSKFEAKCCNSTDLCNTAQHSTFSNRFNQIIMIFASVTISFLPSQRLTTNNA